MFLRGVRSVAQVDLMIGLKWPQPGCESPEPGAPAARKRRSFGIPPGGRRAPGKKAPPWGKGEKGVCDYRGGKPF